MVRRDAFVTHRHRQCWCRHLTIQATSSSSIRRAARWPRRSLQAHLVISDVVMSAPMVVARFRELVPFVRVLLMSGYTEHPHLNVREIAVLAECVRGLLDAETTCAT